MIEIERQILIQKFQGWDKDRISMNAIWPKEYIQPICDFEIKTDEVMTTSDYLIPFWNPES